MNQVLKPFIGHFVVVYFNDILIYRKHNEEHLDQLRQVFQVLKENKLYLSIQKCDFLTKKLLLLGYIISKEWIHTYLRKIKAIVDWTPLKIVTELRSFHGLATFYKRFIRGFSDIAASLTSCLEKEEFRWEKSQHESFDLLKQRVIVAPILALPNFDKAFNVEIDAFKASIRAFLIQEGKSI